MTLTSQIFILEAHRWQEQDHGKLYGTSEGPGLGVAGMLLTRTQSPQCLSWLQGRLENSSHRSQCVLAVSADSKRATSTRDDFKGHFLLFQGGILHFVYLRLCLSSGHIINVQVEEEVKKGRGSCWSKGTVSDGQKKSAWRSIMSACVSK